MRPRYITVKASRCSSASGPLTELTELLTDSIMALAEISPLSVHGFMSDSLLDAARLDALNHVTLSLFRLKGPCKFMAEISLRS